MVVSNHILYIWDLERRFLICPVNTMGLITLHRNYIKEYTDYSNYDFNLGNNFRYCFDSPSQETQKLAQTNTRLVWWFDKGNFASFKIHTAEDKIVLDIKALMHSEKDKTLSSGISILRTREDIFIAQSSRYTDFILYKLEYDRELKRQKVDEGDYEFNEIHSLNSPRMIVVDRVHVHGALEEIQTLTDKAKTKEEEQGDQKTTKTARVSKNGKLEV
jgi:hypothetical protein